jgi:hypothetical protein
LPLEENYIPRSKRIASRFFANSPGTVAMHQAHPL